MRGKLAIQSKREGGHMVFRFGYFTSLSLSCSDSDSESESESEASLLSCFSSWLLCWSPDARAAQTSLSPNPTQH